MARPGFVLAACVAVMLLGAGCGSQREAGLTLRISIWGDVQEQKRVEDAVKGFEAANPGVNVDIEAVPAVKIAGGITAYEQKLIVLIAAQDAPDVMYLPRDRYQFYAEKGAILNLEPFIEESGGAKGFSPEMLEGMEISGGTYGLAKDADTVYTISVQTKHPEEAWALLRYLATGGR
ncbi:MAG: extracellular solute-binding protein [Bacillota bacterium]